MTKSRTAPACFLAACLLALWPAPAAAQTSDPADPAALVEAQRREVRDVVSPRCRSNDDPEAIVVCGRRDDRGPQGPLSALPYAPEPGSIRPGDVAGGEQRAALANDRCLRLCAQPVQIDIIGAVRGIGRAIERLRDDD